MTSLAPTCGAYSCHTVAFSPKIGGGSRMNVQAMLGSIFNWLSSAGSGRGVSGTARVHGLFKPRSQSFADDLSSGEPRRAFLLEDNEANGMVIEGMLDLMGYSETVWVRTIADVTDYEDAIVDGTFAIVLIDVMLPDGESFDLLSRLKGKGVDRLCVYTARTSYADYERYQKIGCDEVFEKPLTLDAFAAGHARLFPRSETN